MALLSSISSIRTIPSVTIESSYREHNPDDKFNLEFKALIAQEELENADKLSHYVKAEQQEDSSQYRVTIVDDNDEEIAPDTSRQETLSHILKIKKINVNHVNEEISRLIAAVERSQGGSTCVNSNANNSENQNDQKERVPYLDKLKSNKGESKIDGISTQIDIINEQQTMDSLNKKLKNSEFRKNRLRKSTACKPMLKNKLEYPLDGGKPRLTLNNYFKSQPMKAPSGGEKGLPKKKELITDFEDLLM